MQSAVPDAVGNKLASDKNTLLAVLQLLRKYNLKVEYVLLMHAIILNSELSIKFRTS